MEHSDDDEPSVPPPLPSIPPLSLPSNQGPPSIISNSESVLVSTLPNPSSLNVTPQSASQQPFSISTQPLRAETLMVRVDQPVEGVEFQPHTLLRGVDGGVVMPSNRRLEYSWLRSKTRRTCEEASCTRQRETATLQDLVTGRRYCSKHCMQLGFRAGGRLVHTTDASRRRIPKSESAIDYDENDHAVWDVRPFVEDSGWTEVGRDRSYVPTQADVGHVLKLVVGALSQDGSATTVSTTSDETPVVIGPPPAPPKRRLIHAHHVLLNPQFADSTALQFRVVTYNMLADIYATQTAFPYCPKWALSWRYRRVQILRELEQYDADILCLQEVQQDHYQQFLLPALERLGYDGLYKCKTREALGPGGKVDGCAILYRRDKFSICGAPSHPQYYEIEFNKAAYQMAQQGAFASSNSAGRDGTSSISSGNRGGLNAQANSVGGLGAPTDAGSQACLKRLCKDNVAHAVVLQGVGMNGEIQHICVANTHIFWDPEYPDVKLWQTHFLLQELEGIAGSRQFPLVLCGDFNSTPESSVYELLAQEQVDPKHPDFIQDRVGILPPASQLTHTLGLVSAVALVTGGEPPVTNFTQQFKGVLDYIWLNESLAAVACLEMPSEDELRGSDDTPLPNTLFPSDHVAICVDIRMASSNGAQVPNQDVIECSQPIKPIMSLAKRKQILRAAGIDIDINENLTWDDLEQIVISEVNEKDLLLLSKIKEFEFVVKLLEKDSERSLEMDGLSKNVLNERVKLSKNLSELEGYVNQKALERKGREDHQVFEKARKDIATAIAIVKEIPMIYLSIRNRGAAAQQLQLELEEA